MKMIEISNSTKPMLEILIQLTFNAAKQHNPHWLPTLEDAKAEVQKTLTPKRINRVLVDDKQPIGWGAVFPLKHGVWELHPLLIDPTCHRKGCGTNLVRELEELAIDEGATSMILSTSDATGATSISGIDLYDNPLEQLKIIDITDAKKGHAFRFWEKMGYSIVGVIPDAEGRGIPSIQFSKRLIR